MKLTEILKTVGKNVVIPATIVATLASPFFGKNSQAFSQEKYDYGIEILIKTGLNGSSTDPAQDANVTITALDIDMDLQSQTVPLTSGMAFFSNAYTDIPSALFTTIKYDFKINGENLGVNIPNVVSANIYNEVGQTLYSQKFNGYSPVAVPSRLVNMADEKTFVEFIDKDGESYVLRKFNLDKGFGFHKSGNWNKTFMEQKDGSKVEIGGKGKATTRYEVKIVPNDGSNMEKTEIDTIDVLLQDGRQTFEMYNLEKIKQQKRIMGTIRNLENLNGIDNAKILVSKMLSDGSFKDLDSTFTDFLGEYTTNRVDIQDSIYLRISKDGFMNTIIDNIDKNAYISYLPMTARLNHADTLQTGKNFQKNIDYIMIENLNLHPLYDSAIAEQIALGNNISELTNNMLVEGRRRNVCQAWAKGNKLGIYLVPGEFTSAEQDSMVTWLDEEARQTGYTGGFNDKYEILTEEPTSPTASWLRIRNGSNEFYSWQYTNEDSIELGYDYDIINRGGDVKVLMRNKDPTLKELTSRPTQDNTVLIRSNSNAIPYHVTIADEIFRTKNLKYDVANFKYGFVNGSKSELVGITPPITKAEKNNQNYLKKNQRNSIYFK
ncbi:MAG: hypothetical protein AB7V77_04940 [Candidatus Woesearchaeota archaeon]